MPPPTPLLHPRNPIHLYRHLLREASYLPPIASPYITGRIQRRFRRNPPGPPSVHLRKAASYIRFLYSANAGSLTSMRYVLWLALGRDGSLRREMMEDLRRKEPPRNTAEMLEAFKGEPTMEEQMRELQKSKAGDGKNEKMNAREPDWLDKWDTDKMMHFAKIQSHQRLQGFDRPDIVSGKLNLEDAHPPTNKWGAPYPVKSGRAKDRKWWKMLAHRILPPVPKNLWKLLETLAEGKAGPEWDPPKRRYAIASEQPRPEAYTFADAATKPIKMLERHNARDRKLACGTETKAEAAMPYIQPALDVHNFTPRVWRRLYMSVWRLCAGMSKNEQTGRWQVQWGGDAPPALTPASDVHADFFSDAENHGQMSPRPAKKFRY